MQKDPQDVREGLDHAIKDPNKAPIKLLVLVFMSSLYNRSDPFSVD